MLPFPPVLNLSQLQTGCRSQGEEKQRVLLESFKTSPLFSSPLPFLPTCSGEELSWLLVLSPAADTVPLLRGSPAPCGRGCCRPQLQPWLRLYSTC